VMTSDTSPRPVSPLRARMIEDMTVRGFNEHMVVSIEADPRQPTIRSPSTGPDNLSRKDAPAPIAAVGRAPRTR
jgi:hypothetical protein